MTIMTDVNRTHVENAALVDMFFDHLADLDRAVTGADLSEVGVDDARRLLALIKGVEDALVPIVAVIDEDVPGVDPQE